MSYGSNAAAQDDFQPENTQWNGLSEFVQISTSLGIELEISNRVNLPELTPNDALIVVYPRESLPERSLVAFLRSGGRVALLDDFGEGHELLDAYGIVRVSGSLEGSPLLRGNPALPIATPLLEHDLTQGVSALVTNHPTEVYHSDLRPLFGQVGRAQGVVLSGAVGQGRFVVLSDPSVVINNMISFRGNRAFAENLLRYIARKNSAGGTASMSGGRVILVTPDAEYEGRYGSADGTPFEELGEWLDKIAHADTPAAVLLLLACLFLAILVGVVLASLPRKSPYQRMMVDKDGPLSPAKNRTVHGGLWGRVEYFRRTPKNLFHPLMVYKYELEAEVVHRLGMGKRTLLRDVIAGLGARNLPDEEIEAARDLFSELDHLRAEEMSGARPKAIHAAQLREFVRRGERVRRSLSKPAHGSAAFHDSGARK